MKKFGPRPVTLRQKNGDEVYLSHGNDLYFTCKDADDNYYGLYYQLHEVIGMDFWNVLWIHPGGAFARWPPLQ